MPSKTGAPVPGACDASTTSMSTLTYTASVPSAAASMACRSTCSIPWVFTSLAVDIFSFWVLYIRYMSASITLPFNPTQLMFL